MHAKHLAATSLRRGEKEGKKKPVQQPLIHKVQELKAGRLFRREYDEVVIWRQREISLFGGNHVRFAVRSGLKKE